MHVDSKTFAACAMPKSRARLPELAMDRSSGGASSKQASEAEARPTAWIPRRRRPRARLLLACEDGFRSLGKIYAAELGFYRAAAGNIMAGGVAVWTGPAST